MGRGRGEEGEEHLCGPVEPPRDVPVSWEEEAECAGHEQRGGRERKRELHVAQPRTHALVEGGGEETCGRKGPAARHQGYEAAGGVGGVGGGIDGPGPSAPLPRSAPPRSSRGASNSSAPHPVV